MHNCNQCGKPIRDGSGEQRLMQTGNFSGGKAYHRTVNLCDGCSRKVSHEGVTKKKNIRALVALGVIVALVLALFATGVLQFGKLAWPW
jgi:hypothetical protein